MTYTIRCWCPTCSELREWRRRADRVQPLLIEQVDSLRSACKVLTRLVRLYLSAALGSLLGMAKEKDPMAAGRKANQKAAKQKADIESRARGVIQRDQIRNKDLREGTNTERQTPKHRKS